MAGVPEEVGRHVQLDQTSVGAALAPRVVGLSSTSSMTSARPAGIGPCMSPGRMGICPSDGWGVNLLRSLLRVRPGPVPPVSWLPAGPA